MSKTKLGHGIKRHSDSPNQIPQAFKNKAQRINFENFKKELIPYNLKLIKSKDCELIFDIVYYARSSFIKSACPLLNKLCPYDSHFEIDLEGGRAQPINAETIHLQHFLAVQYLLDRICDSPISQASAVMTHPMKACSDVAAMARGQFESIINLLYLMTGNADDMILKFKKFGMSAFREEKKTHSHPIEMPSVKQA